MKLSLIRKDLYLLRNSWDTVLTQLLIPFLILLFLKFPNHSMLIEFCPYIMLSTQLVMTAYDILNVKDKKAGISKILNIAYKKSDIAASRLLFLMLLALGFDILYWFVQKYAYFIFRLATRPLTLPEYIGVCCYTCVVFLFMNMFYCLFTYEKAKKLSMVFYLVPFVLVFFIVIWSSASRKAEVIHLAIDGKMAAGALAVTAILAVVTFLVSVAGYRK